MVVFDWNMIYGWLNLDVDYLYYNMLWLRKIMFIEKKIKFDSFGVFFKVNFKDFDGCD